MTSSTCWATWPLALWGRPAATALPVRRHRNLATPRCSRHAPAPFPTSRLPAKTYRLAQSRPLSVIVRTSGTSKSATLCPTVQTNWLGGW
jgi:hypothetical protein